jgi:hypothetical protein
MAGQLVVGWWYVYVDLLWCIGAISALVVPLVCIRLGVRVILVVVIVWAPEKDLFSQICLQLSNKHLSHFGRIPSSKISRCCK